MSILQDKTQSTLELISDEFNGVLGIHAIDPFDPSHEFEVYADEVFPTASVIKIPVLLEFYKQVKEGDLDPSEVVPLNEEDLVGGSGILQFLTPEATQLTVEDYCRLMITISDNTATNFMIDWVGMENVNRLLSELGFTETKLRRKMQAVGVDYDLMENVSTPRELSNLLAMMLSYDGLDPEVCEKSLEMLRIHKPGIIRDSLPVNMDVSDKSGWMGGVQCDSGIVHLEEKPYIVTIMAKSIPEWDRDGQDAKETMKSAVSEIHDYFVNISTASMHGRRIA